MFDQIFQPHAAGLAYVLTLRWVVFFSPLGDPERDRLVANAYQRDFCVNFKVFGGGQKIKKTAVIAVCDHHSMPLISKRSS